MLLTATVLGLPDVTYSHSIRPTWDKIYDIVRVTNEQ
jgi:hypothetical protein